MRISKSSKGMTLIELLVSISIIGILVGLLLPAVQQARESARRAACANHLKQIGVAVSSYCASHNAFPYIGSGFYRSGQSGEYTGFNVSSAFVSMLPFMEETSLYSAINLSRPGVQDALGGRPYQSRPHPANDTAARTQLLLFICPSDPIQSVGEWGGTNYRTNMGTVSGVQENGLTPIESRNGGFEMRKALTAAEFTDGLSMTAGFGEKNRGEPVSRFAPFSGFWMNTNSLYTTQRELVQVCRSLQGEPQIFQNDVGNIWFLPYYRYTFYNHVVGPNSGIPDCIGAWDAMDPPHDRGLFAARSYHPGGVNTLFMDGHCKFHNNSIDVDVWRSLGTRNGGEVAESN